MACYTYGNWETSSKKQDIKTVRNTEEITNPEKLAELFNSYFCQISEELFKENGVKVTVSEIYHSTIKKRLTLCFCSQWSIKSGEES
jgi:hypothetical protein